MNKNTLVKLALLAEASKELENEPNSENLKRANEQIRDKTKGVLKESQLTKLEKKG